MIEKSTGIARVAGVDAAGIFELKQVKSQKDHTLVIVSPDFILQSVLSIPGSTANTIHQFFRPKELVLPHLIHRGDIVTVEDTSKIDVSSELAADADGDGVPDGSVSIGGTASSSLSLMQTTDLDQDGAPNESDPDIDGDGVINVIDPDDDGDAIIDVVDLDANGNVINDVAEKNGDLFFNEAVEFIAVEYESKPKTSGVGSTTSLTFSVKIRDSVAPISVQIYGAPSLLDGASVVTQVANEETGDLEEALTAWNRLLGDDGLSNDRAESDRLFAKKVQLADGKLPPRAHQMVFFRLSFGSEDNPWFMDFPYTFPDLTPSTVSAQYDPLTRNVTLVGTPFGQNLSDYIWVIDIVDDTGISQWTSSTISGTEKTFQVPANVLDADGTYQFSVVAQVLDKVPGFPAYKVHSPVANLE